MEGRGLQLENLDGPEVRIVALVKSVMLLHAAEIFLPAIGGRLLGRAGRLRGLLGSILVRLVAFVSRGMRRITFVGVQRLMRQLAAADS